MAADHPGAEMQDAIHDSGPAKVARFKQAAADCALPDGDLAALLLMTLDDWLEIAGECDGQSAGSAVEERMAQFVALVAELRLAYPQRAPRSVLRVFDERRGGTPLGYLTDRPDALYDLTAALALRRTGRIPFHPPRP